MVSWLHCFWACDQAAAMKEADHLMTMGKQDPLDFLPLGSTS